MGKIHFSYEDPVTLLFLENDNIMLRVINREDLSGQTTHQAGSIDKWLDPDHHDPQFLGDFLQPYPDDAMKEHIVGKAAGNVRNNEEGLIKKADLFG